MTETSAFASSLPSHRPLGTPLGAHPTRVLFLGSGELGKEVTIELMRLGAWVCAADSYTGAPAQQVANEARVLDMADAARLRTLFDEVRPDIIVPEVEAIATGELSDAAARGVQHFSVSFGSCNRHTCIIPRPCNIWHHRYSGRSRRAESIASARRGPFLTFLPSSPP